MYTGVRLRRSPGATALGFAGWGEGLLAPTGMPLSGPDMSHKNTRLVSASDEAAGSDEADPLAVGLIVPLGWNEEGEWVTTAA